jgi:hypothetical protein
VGLRPNLTLLNSRHDGEACEFCMHVVYIGNCFAVSPLGDRGSTSIRCSYFKERELTLGRRKTSQETWETFRFFLEWLLGSHTATAVQIFIVEEHNSPVEPELEHLFLGL